MRVADLPLLSKVRRFEAVSFRSWPATTTQYHGTWAIRLTAGHPAKRLNSVNPLDPFDKIDLEKRLIAVEQRFKAFGRPLTFRLSPLTPRPLNAIFDQRGWNSFDETIVMSSDLQKLDLSVGVDQVPLQDVGRWIDDVIAMGGAEAETKPGLSELISSIESRVGLFVMEQSDGNPLCATMCVRDNELAGLFQMITHPQMRGNGYGAKILATALRWAKKEHAEQAWLQVEANNEAALSLYRRFGFQEVYRYVYRQPPDDGGQS